MLRLLSLCLLISVFNSNGQQSPQNQQSPCDKGGHRRIPNEGLRYVHFKITPEDTPFHDSRLLESWYYVGNNKMPEYAPDLYSCGTLYPIWLDGPHPEDDNPVDASACLKDLDNNCIKTFAIRIMRCPDMFYLYYLPPTDDTTEGYCFGEGNPGDGTDYIAPAPTVTASRIHQTIEGFPVSKTIFECFFEESTTDVLFYQVSWLRDGETWYITSSETTSGHVNHRLTEELFVDKGFRLGQNIACAVRAYKVLQGRPGKVSDKSQDLFAGIRVLTPTLTFTRGETDKAVRTIRIQPTVPIGCRFLTECEIWLTAYTPPETIRGQCNGITLEKSTCGMIIRSEAYSDEYEIIVDTTETGQYQTTDGVYEIFLKTDTTSHNLIWRDYGLPAIKVTVLKPPPANIGHQGKICKAQSDPHMGTFDGRPYDNHRDGIFIMYRHTEFDTEIQIEHESCNSGSYDVKCVCGLAVRAGRDLYRLRVCERKIFIGFIKCDDGVLEVKSINEYHYKIFLPYGTYVDVRVRVITNPLPKDGDRTLELSVIPSSFDDKGKARGLCGLMGEGCTNDFHDRNGLTQDLGDENGICSDDRFWLTNQPDKFINHWKVNDVSVDFFHKDFDFSKVESWPFHICVCENSTDNVDIVERIPCNKNTVATCSKGKTVGKHTCDSPARRRRSVKGDPKIPTVELPSGAPYDTRVKVVATVSLKYRREESSQNWTEEDAREFCESYMNRSVVYSLCSDVPSVTPYESVEICVLDVLISHGTGWASTNMENMQGSCLSELSRNVTLRETEDEGPSLAEHIEAVACPGNCSSSGTCLEGECQCNEGLGGADCSLDMSTGPTISGLLDDGLCDERDIPCDHAYVFGHIFIDSTNLTCSLHEFTISREGERAVHDVYHVPGEFETLIEVICPIETANEQQSEVRNDNRMNDIFVHGYTVSVSNDGLLFEDGRDLFIYDSECQTPIVVDEETHFSLKENFCFIEQMCVSHGTLHPSASCLMCDSQNSTATWSWNSNDPECSGKVTDEPDDVTTDSPDGNTPRAGATTSSLSYIVCLIILALCILPKSHE